MLILRSKIIGSGIVDARSQTKIGLVLDLILAQNEPTIAGMIGKDSFFGPILVLAREEIMGIEEGYVIANDEDALTSLDDNRNLKKLVSIKSYGIGQKVVTKSGKTIGKVHDILFDSQHLTINKYYIKSLLAEKIIPADAVIKVTARKITIKDDFEKVPSYLLAAKTSVI